MRIDSYRAEKRLYQLYKDLEIYEAELKEARKNNDARGIEYAERKIKNIKEAVVEILRYFV